MVNEYRLMLKDRTPYLVCESCHECIEEITSPEQIVNIMNTCFSLNQRAEEYVYMMAMDTGGHALGVFEISHGTVNYSLISAREVMLRLLLCGGVTFALVHNHPSGKTEPSREDKNVCRQIQEAAKLMDFKMLDFIIVGQGFFSFEEEDMI